jgi:hypothetical protein
MRNITKTNKKEIKMKTTHIENNTIELEILNHYLTASMNLNNHRYSNEFDNVGKEDEENQKEYLWNDSAPTYNNTNKKMSYYIV